MHSTEQVAAAYKSRPTSVHVRNRGGDSGPRGRTLAGVLRQLREDAGLSCRTLAGRLGVSAMTISRWERGLAAPALEDVASFLAHLGVTGRERNRVLDLARTGGATPDWLVSDSPQPGIPHALAGLLELERTATVMTECSPLLIPGILQTADYARAIIARPDRASHETDLRVTVRMGRRDALTRQRPLRILAFVGEPAIRANIGGTHVMLDQLRHLLAMAGLPAVTVRVLPVTGGWHPGLMGPFILYDFADDPAIVLVEHHRSSVFLYNFDDVDGYRLAADTLGNEALSVEESRAMILTAITEREASR